MAPYRQGVTPEQAVLWHPRLRLAERTIVLARMDRPELPVPELAELLGCDRRTVQRALAKARGLALGAAPVPQGAAPTPPRGGTHAAGAAPTPPPRAQRTALPGMEGQVPPPPPAPPTPAPTDPARKAVADVRRLRRAAGLATTEHDRDIAHVLAQLRADGHPLAEVVEAAGRSLVVSPRSVAIAINERRVQRPTATERNPTFLSTANVVAKGEDPDQW